MHFSSIPIDGPTSKKITDFAALGISDRQLAVYAHQLERALPPLPKTIGRELRAMLGLSRGRQTMHATNLRTRSAFATKLISIAGARYGATPDRRYKLVTIKPDSWLLDEHAPRVPLLQARNETTRWMREMDFEGLGFFELTPLLHHPHFDGAGTALAWHFHAFGTVRTARSHQRGLAKLRLRDAAHNSLDRGVHVGKIDPTRGDHERVAGYASKLKAVAKNIVPNTKKGHGYRVFDRPISNRLLLRTTEILSHMSLSDLIVTRGPDAWAARQDAFKACDEEVWRRSSARYDVVPPNKVWTTVWQVLGQPQYAPVRIDRL